VSGSEYPAAHGATAPAVPVLAAQPPALTIKAAA